jgi:HEAT repeat protein
MSGSRRPGRTRSALTIALVALGLAPTLAVVKRAIAQDESAADEGSQAPPASDIARKRRAVLRGLSTDETSLINVTAREMPASPDVLNLGRRASRALARCVSDNVDDGLRTLCAELLGRIGDRAALPALQGALEAWDPRVRGAAIQALAKMPDRGSVEPLAKILERDDEGEDNRAAALLALGAESDTRAMRVVRDALLHPKAGRADLRLAAFRALWKCRHLMARETLVSDVDGALKSDDPALVLQATFAASELRAPELRESLVRLMTHADPRVRNRAVYAVGKIGDKAATSALLAFVPKIRESRMLNNTAFALERLDPKAFFTTAKGLITNKQAQIRMNTAFVLGDVRRPEGLELLRGALDDKNDTVRLSAVRALGNLEAPEGAALLERFVEDPNQSLRRAAIYAIFALSHMQRADLVRDKLYSSDRPDVKLEAALALGRAGDPAVAGDLLTCLETGRCNRAAVDAFLHANANANATKAREVPGRMLLAWARGRSDLTDLVAFLRPPGGGDLAVSDVLASVGSGDLGRAGVALDLSGDLGDARALEVLRPLLTHESARLRLHAAVALARSGRAEADGVLLADLDNLPRERLPLFVRLASRIAEPAARARLGPELLRREKSDDAAVAVAAAAVRLAWDPENAIFPMLDALAAPTRFERNLAESYLRKDPRPIVTFLLRRALAREPRGEMREQLRRILDARAGSLEEQ